MVEVELVCWFFNNMNVERWLWLVFNPLKVSIDGVLGAGTKSILKIKSITTYFRTSSNLEKPSEGLKSVRLVGEDEVAIFFHIHGVVQGDLLGCIVLIDDLCSDILIIIETFPLFILISCLP